MLEMKSARVVTITCMSLRHCTGTCCFADSPRKTKENVFGQSELFLVESILEPLIDVYWSNPSQPHEAAILEKVYMQFQSFLDDPVYREEHQLHLELVATFARVGPNAEQKFRDECKYCLYSCMTSQGLLCLCV
ncbi:hypothetical protein ACF0H5_006827 [Mactra antiquata]